MVSRAEVRLDVAHAAPGGANLQTAATVVYPSELTTQSRQLVMFTYPGTTYSRSYYDFHAPGRDGYSFAEHLASAGHVVITCDHVGVGDSTPYEPFDDLTAEVVADVGCAAVQAALTRLADGRLVGALPPIERPYIVGVGHSLGAYIALLQQGRGQPFDAIALLGASWPYVRDGWNDDEAYAALVSMMPDLTRPPRALFHTFFYDEHVPEDVIAADDATAIRTYPWVFLPDRWGFRGDDTGFETAREIDVPVFLAFGARDTSPDPRAEAALYPRSPDVTTFVLPDSAHCHVLAATRQLFFDRIASWGESLVRSYGDAKVG